MWLFLSFWTWIFLSFSISPLNSGRILTRQSILQEVHAQNLLRIKRNFRPLENCVFVLASSYLNKKSRFLFPDSVLREILGQRDLEDEIHQALAQSQSERQTQSPDKNKNKDNEKEFQFKSTLQVFDLRLQIEDCKNSMEKSRFLKHGLNKEQQQEKQERCFVQISFTPIFKTIWANAPFTSESPQEGHPWKDHQPRFYYADASSDIFLFVHPRPGIARIEANPEQLDCQFPRFYMDWPYNILPVKVGDFDAETIEPFYINSFAQQKHKPQAQGMEKFLKFRKLSKGLLANYENYLSIIKELIKVQKDFERSAIWFENWSYFKGFSDDRFSEMDRVSGRLSSVYKFWNWPALSSVKMAMILKKRHNLTLEGVSLSLVSGKNSIWHTFCHRGLIRAQVMAWGKFAEEQVTVGINRLSVLHDMNVQLDGRTWFYQFWVPFRPSVWSVFSLTLCTLILLIKIGSMASPTLMILFQSKTIEAGIKGSQNRSESNKIIVRSDSGQKLSKTNQIIVRSNSGQNGSKTNKIIVRSNSGQNRSHSNKITVRSNSGQKLSKSNKIIVRSNSGQKLSRSNKIIVRSDSGQNRSHIFTVGSGLGQNKSKSNKIIVRSNSGQNRSKSNKIVVRSNSGQNIFKSNKTTIRSGAGHRAPKNAFVISRSKNGHRFQENETKSGSRHNLKSTSEEKKCELKQGEGHLKKSGYDCKTNDPILLFVLKPFIGQTSKIFRLLSLPTPEGFTTQVFYSFWVLCTFFIVSFYFATLQSYRVFPVTSGSPKTLQELIDQDYHLSMRYVGLVDHIKLVTAWQGFATKIFNVSQKNFSLLLDHEKLLNLTVGLNIPESTAYQLRQYFKQEKIGRILNPEDLSIYSKLIPQLFQKPFFIMEQQFFVFPLVWIFLMPYVQGPVDSFKMLLNNGIYHFWEQVYTTNYNKWHQHNGLTKIFKREPEGRFLDFEFDSTTSAFSLALVDDLIKGSFYFVVIGMSFAVIAFAIEILSHRHSSELERVKRRMKTFYKRKLRKRAQNTWAFKKALGFLQMLGKGLKFWNTKRKNMKEWLKD